MNETFKGPVVIADDGELSDIRALLSELGVEFVSRTDAAGKRREEAELAPLLITTPRYAVTVNQAVPNSSALVVVVFDEISRTLRGALERSGCDFVVQRPVHTAAFRLLVIHALYRGPERRRQKRAAIAAPVKFKLARRSVQATLMQLSARGCGLVCSRDVDRGSAIQLTLPRELTGGKSLVLPGRVVAVDRDAQGVSNLSVAFDPVSAVAKRMLHQVMKTNALGSAALPSGHPGSPALPSARPGASTVSAPLTPTTSKAERRRSQRKRFSQRILAGGGGSSQVLIGCDLSTGGMRVAPNPDLALGDELKLALYGGAGRPPVMLKALVVRGDEDGWVLEFRDMSPEAVAKLEQVVASLPQLATSSDQSPGAGTVVSEIVDRAG